MHLLSALLVLLVAVHLAHASFSISPEGSELVQCEPVTMTWTEAPPIQLWAVPNREVDPGDPVLVDFGIIDASSLQWTVQLNVGQNVSFTYTQQSNPDSVLVSADEYVVGGGPSTTCLFGENSTLPTSNSSADAITSSGPPSSTQVASSTPASGVTPSSSSATASGVATPTKTDASNRWIIAIGIVIGVFVCAIPTTLIVWWRKRRNQQTYYQMGGAAASVDITAQRAYNGEIITHFSLEHHRPEETPTMPLTYTGPPGSYSPPPTSLNTRMASTTGQGWNIASDGTSKDAPPPYMVVSNPVDETGSGVDSHATLS